MSHFGLLLPERVSELKLTDKTATLPFYIGFVYVAFPARSKDEVSKPLSIITFVTYLLAGIFIHCF